jgi:hypothetical protein
MPRVVIPILVGLFAGVLFVASNVTAQHDPQPHGVPITVSGGPAAPLQRRLGPHYVVTRHASPRPRCVSAGRTRASTRAATRC